MYLNQDTVLQIVYLDQQMDGSRGPVGNVVPEGEFADDAGLFPNRAPNMSFISLQAHRCSFQIDKMT